MRDVDIGAVGACRRINRGLDGVLGAAGVVGRVANIQFRRRSRKARGTGIRRDEQRKQAQQQRYDRPADGHA